MSIETIGSKEAELSGDLSGDTHTIHGRVIKGGDVTVGKSGDSKLWKPEAIEEAAESLKGSNLVKNHVNDKVESVVGKITDVKYRDDRGLLFKGNVSDNSIAKQVKDNLLDVSARINHKDTEELDKDDSGNYIVDSIKSFDNLSFVPDGAAPSNDVSYGSTTELSTAELSEPFESDTEDVQSGSDSQEDANPSEDTEPNEEELTETEELTEVHSPSYSGTSDSSEWSKPAMEDFDTDDLSEISDHFLVSKSEFPPEDYGELSLPVVNSSGTLVLGGLDSSWKMASQTDGVSGDQLSSVKTKIKNLTQDEFPDSDLASRVSDSDEEENAKETESAEELEEEDEEGDLDINALSVMSDDELDDMMEGESTETEENQSDSGLAVYV